MVTRRGGKVERESDGVGKVDAGGRLVERKQSGDREVLRRLWGTELTSSDLGESHGGKGSSINIHNTKKAL